ncbi:hypothetical protein N9F16_00455 [bacterium]|nr:hypothetical protein [bacterium]
MEILSNLKKGLFPFIIAFTALSVSASAAFYSVSGLSKLFAGAAFEVIIMAGSLEVAKLVIASLLYQYWSVINKGLRVYLTVATFILVLITSMGIYGFLSSAYQDTYRQLTIKNNQTSFLTQKKDFYNKDVIRYDEELERISNNISTLSNAKVSNIQVRDTTVSSGFRSTISTTELRLSQKRIDVEEQNRKDVQAKREQVADSLQKYQLAILELENDSDVAGELGPLEYLSKLTNTSMDKIINYLLLVIIFVFDPLAISLVISANFAFDQAYPKKEEEEIEEAEEVEDEEEKTEDIEVEHEIVTPSDLTEEERLQLFAIYGESGSLDVYEEEEDWEIESETSSSFEDETTNIVKTKKDELTDQLSNLESYLNRERIGGINQTLERNLKKEISILKSQIDGEDDDTTIIY